MRKEIAFIIIGLSFAVALSILSTQFSISCPDTGTRVIWTINFVFIILMLIVFSYGAHLFLHNKRKIKRAKKHH